MLPVAEVQQLQSCNKIQVSADCACSKDRQAYLEHNLLIFIRTKMFWEGETVDEKETQTFQ
jgi:hypothetical protein